MPREKEFLELKNREPTKAVINYMKRIKKKQKKQHADFEKINMPLSKSQS